MGKHKRTNQLLARGKDAKTASDLRVQQRKLEKQQAILRMALVAAVSLLAIVVLSAIRPAEQASISSPASNILPGGISTKLSAASTNIEQAADEPFVNAVLTYLSIDDISLQTLEKTTITPSDTDYFALTRRATGHPSETKHQFNGQIFYDSPLNNLLLRSGQPLPAFIGESSQTSDIERTGIDGREFIILPELGIIAVNKTTGGDANTRVLASSPIVQPNGDVSIFIETQLSSGALSNDAALSIDIPSNVKVTSLSSPSSLPNITTTKNNITFSARADQSIGGNKSLWAEISLRADPEIDDPLCINAAFTASTFSSLFSDTQCIQISNTETAIASTCERQANGSYRLFGNAASTTNLDCISRFENAVYRTLSITSDSTRQLTYTVSERNLGTNDTQSIGKLDIADSLEYTALDASSTSIELQDNTFAQWNPKTILSNDTTETTINLVLDRPLSNSSTAISDRYSYDFNLSTVIEGNETMLEINPSSVKEIESFSLASPTVSSKSTITILSIIVVVLTANYAHNFSVLHKTKHGRRAITGELNHG